ncbi:MAG: sigma 54-interacting transcriptional regulator [bacterium]
MNTRLFWNEEIRTFPHGCRAAALWVVRRDGPDPAGPLHLVFRWSLGSHAARSALGPPLGAMMRSIQDQREELLFPDGKAALWIEPLGTGERSYGSLALWFEADEPWREGIFLWVQRLAGRLGPLLPQLDVCRDGEGWPEPPGQLRLFPATCVGMDGGVSGRGRRRAPVDRKGDRPLPRPQIIPGIPGCIGVSEEMVRLGATLQGVARSEANVLLYGESGTGKEIIAAAVHALGPRGKGPFVGQNCAALPESLFESELFGHRAGAFTGAAGDKKGLLASADGGTFFLDEIGDMPLSLQIKLLRVMQERKVRRIGELQARPVDIRFVAATHKNLFAEIAAGNFRLDLYYRLKVVSLEVPPLRHRPEDVAHLFAYFLRRNGRPIPRMTMTDECLAALQAWRWPGNVRELENEVQRFLALYPQVSTIELHHLSPEIRDQGTRPVDPADLGTLRELDKAGEMLERYLIRKAIAAAGGRKAAAARRLGLSRQGLYKKIQRYGMTDLIAST